MCWCFFLVVRLVDHLPRTIETSEASCGLVIQVKLKGLLVHRQSLVTTTQVEDCQLHEYARIPTTNMRMKPEKSSGYPGRTYQFYKGRKVFEFGYGVGYSPYSNELLSAT
ncbi:hypothetical protein Nepgr_010648 [Nepenthes gracilis]|uniref:Uncharacterized protein n=1 Tax=Nepenthes gracilis TaxID=150966 RepID=A0AAD3SCS2_NEPGR|nr:hypothetical protein Nepgr_010648 [Nepenthes gracilis]